MTNFGLLLFFLLAKTLAEEDPEPIFRAAGEEMEMGYCFGMDYIIVYKVTEKGKQLLGNSSSTGVIIPKAYSGRISPTNELRELLGMQVKNLTLSDSGVYMRECWLDHKLMKHDKYHLYVCDEEVRSQNIVLDSDESANLVCNVANSGGNTETIKWFRETNSGYKTSMFLDTKRSLEPLQEELKGLLQVQNKGVSLHVSKDVLKNDSHFFCLVMEGEQCKGFQNIHLPDSNDLELKSVFLGVGEKVVLPCKTELWSQREIYWETPFGKVNSTTSSSSGKEIYMANSEKTSDYSLVILSITSRHSGEYTCFSTSQLEEYFITVCSELVSDVVQLHPGSKVTLPCKATTESVNIQWYRQNDHKKDQLIYDSGDPSLQPPEDIKDRMHEQDTSLIITDLTEKDSGTYWCVVLLENTDDYSDDDLSEGEEETDDETDDDDWMTEEENPDECAFKQVVQLTVQSKISSTLITEHPRKSEPEPESSILPVIGGVVGVIVIIVLIVVVVVLTLRAKRKSTNQSRPEPSPQQKESVVSEPLLDLKQQPQSSKDIC